MRAFKIWNKTRTSSFNLSGLNVITTNVAGLGNKFTNDLYDSRIKKHLISQTNSFEQINLTVNFGVHSNAYQKYREFMNFIQANGRNILVIEYYTPGASRFVDVVLSNASKNQKTGFGVLVETVSFDRLTPYYILQRRTGRSVLVSNRYLENVVPRLELKNNLYPTGTKIRVKSKNEGMPDLTGKTHLGGGVYSLFNANGVSFTYNIYTCIYTLNKSIGYDGFIKLSDIDSSLGSITLQVWVISGKEQSQLDIMIRQPNEPYIVIGGGRDYRSISKTLTTENQFSIYLDVNDRFNNFQFKLQLEKAGNNLELDRAKEEFNGKTLREWFDSNQLVTNGDFSIDTTGYGLADYWAVGVDVLSNHRILDNMQYWTGTTTSSNSRLDQQFPSLPLGSKVYASVTSINVNSLRMLWGDQYILNSMVDGYNSKIETLTSGSFTGIYFQTRVANVESGVKNVVFINISTLIANKQYSPLYNTTFDLMSDAQIKAQMDYWFNIYQTLRETPTEYSKPITTTQEIELNESILSNQELIIDSENKTVTLNGANAYQITNKDKSTFLNLPEGDYLVECDTPITVEYKRWVID